MAVERAEPYGDNRENRSILIGSWASTTSEQVKHAKSKIIFLFMVKILSFVQGNGYLLPVLVLERELDPLDPDERLLLPLLLLLLLLLPLLLLYEPEELPLLELLVGVLLFLLYELLLEELLLLLLLELLPFDAGAGVLCR
jgi:hypothetical protein